MDESTIEIQTDRPAQPTACKFEIVGRDQVGAALGHLLPEVFAWLEEGHGIMAGPPYARYHAGPEGKFDLEAGIPVAPPVVGDDRVHAGVLPGGRCAVATHVGPYERLSETHQRLHTFVADHGETVAGPPWEVYVTDPGEEPDPERWTTLVVLPLEERHAV